MVETCFSFPNMFDVSRNKLNVYQDTKAITTRVKLLLLTEPTELYMNPTFGVGLKKYIFTYNNDNTIALIRDKLIEQLRIWEPGVIPEDTKVERGLLYTGTDEENNVASSLDNLNLTITLTTSHMQYVSFGITKEDFENLTM